MDDQRRMVIGEQCSVLLEESEQMISPELDSNRPIRTGDQ
jgi:hypothetical protein